VNVNDLGATILSLITVMLLVGSLVYWGWFFRKLRNGENPVPRRFRPQTVHVPALAVVPTLALLGFYLHSLLFFPEPLSKLSLKDIRLSVLGTLAEGLLVLMVLLPAVILLTRSRTDLYRLGFRADHLGDQIREGVLGLVAVVIPMGIMLILTAPIRSTETEHPFLRLLKETSFGNEMLIILFSAAVIAPLKEELMFRVVFQSWLEEFCPAWLAIALSAGVFSAIHGFPDALALIPLAILLGVHFQRRRSYLSVVIVHGLFNAYNLAATIFSET